MEKPIWNSEEIIRAFYACYNGGDVEGVLSLMSDDIEYHDMVQSMLEP